MHETNLRAIDLNLLVILQALLEHKHITAAARSLKMSQPAVSRALQRLRKTLDDPLLIRGTVGYDLSTRALEIAPRLNAVMLEVQQITKPPRFDPLTATDTIKLWGLDLEMIGFVTRLIALLQQQAPNLVIEISSQPADQFELLAQNQTHFVLSGFQPQQQQDQFHQLKIAETNLVCIVGNDNPLAKGSLTLERYIHAKHGVVSITGSGPTHMDAVLQKKGYKRRIALRISNFFSAAEICETSDIIFAMPRLIAERVTNGKAVQIRAMPDELDTGVISFYLYWHSRNHRNPMCQWVRKIIAQSLANQPLVTNPS